jgi:23S rRNA (adenine2503-C2)-methyltransferase
VATAKDARPDLADLDLAALEALFLEEGLPRFRARQVFAWIHQHGVADFTAMTNLGRELRAQLTARFRISTPSLAHEDRSTDGTRKFLF